MLTKTKLKLFALATVASAFIANAGNIVFADGGSSVKGAYHHDSPGFFNYLRRFFEPGYFEPHYTHFVGDEALLWVLVIANIVTFVAYTAIPIILFYFARKKKNFEFSKIFFLFGAFIILCGAHHLIHVVTFWYPVYYLQGLADALMAIVSVATGVALIPVLPVALAMKTPTELEHLNKQLADEVKQRKAAEQELKDHTKNLKTTLDEETKTNAEIQRMNEIMTGRELKMAELKLEITNLKDQIANLKK